MNDELYYKLIEILTLGNLKWRETLDKLQADDFVLVYELQNKYSLDSYTDIVKEFIVWKRGCTNA